MAVQEMINISTYKFVSIPEQELVPLRDNLRDFTRDLGLKGSILLSKEGINAFVSGKREQIDTFHAKLETISWLRGLQFKESPSVGAPFKRMLVKIKNEIIKMCVDHINPEEFTAPHLPAKTLKQWYEQGQKMVILDTRNNYEIQAGKFKDTLDLN
nr:sulfurtransferase [Pseudomonadota bacterium]